MLVGEDGEDVCGGRALKRTTTTLHDGVLPHKSPMYPNYVTFNSRRESFTTWPLQLTQTPDQLASAGFFYTGCGDKVRCFSGGCGLEKWEPGDDPVLEHKKWYPDCFFVMMKTTGSDTGPVRRETLIEEKSDLDLIDPVCKICLTETAQVVFLPCGHLLSCTSCAPSLASCPVCRSQIQGMVRAYLA